MGTTDYGSVAALRAARYKIISQGQY